MIWSVDYSFLQWVSPTSLHVFVGFSFHSINCFPLGNKSTGSPKKEKRKDQKRVLSRMIREEGRGWKAECRELKERTIL